MLNLIKKIKLSTIHHFNDNCFAGLVLAYSTILEGGSNNRNSRFKGRVYIKLNPQYSIM